MGAHVGVIVVERHAQRVARGIIAQRENCGEESAFFRNSFTIGASEN
jgi:hypothetical protein